MCKNARSVLLFLVAVCMLGLSPHSAQSRVRDGQSEQTIPAAKKQCPILVLYVRFPEDNRVNMLMQGEKNTPEEDEKHLYNLFFGEGGSLGSTSVKQFYADVTDGIVDIVPAKETYGVRNNGIIVVEIPGRHGNWGNKRTQSWDDVLATPAFREAARYIDFDSYDMNGDRTLFSDSELCVGMYVQGHWGRDNPPERPGMSGVSRNFGLWVGNTKIDRLFVGGGRQGDLALTMGSPCHEIGHALLGFSDLYGETRLGYWSLMSNASQPTPGPIDAFSLVQSGLVKPVVLDKNAEGEFVAEGYTGIYRINTDDPNQYFLLQPRDGAAPQAAGAFRFLDTRHTPIFYEEKGLLILHVVKTGGEEFPFVMEAHGGGSNLIAPKWDSAMSNLGDLGDLFNVNNGGRGEFGPDTDPSSNLYDMNASITSAPASDPKSFLSFGKTVPSGIRIHDIRPVPGKVNAVSFKMGGKPDPNPQIGNKGTRVICNGIGINLSRDAFVDLTIISEKDMNIENTTKGAVLLDAVSNKYYPKDSPEWSFVGESQTRRRVKGNVPMNSKVFFDTPSNYKLTEYYPSVTCVVNGQRLTFRNVPLLK